MKRELTFSIRFTPVAAKTQKVMRTKKVLPPRFFQIALLAIVAIHFVFPGWYVYDFPIRFIGFLPVIIGAFLNIYSDRLIKRHKTTIKPFEKPSALIEEGPFKYSRNPIYLGMVLIIAGGAIFSGAALTFPVPFLFALVLHFYYIKYEEQILKEEFGSLYSAYSRRVKRWL